MTSQQLYRQENVPIPPRGEIIVFRSLRDGFRYYKKSDGTVVKLVSAGNGDTYILPPSVSVNNIVNATGDTLRAFQTESGFALSFSAPPSVAPAVAMAYNRPRAGSQGPQGYQGPQGSVLSGASLSLTITNPTIINGNNEHEKNFYATSALTAWTASFLNIPDGTTVYIDYLKTTVADTIITFPVNTIVSQASDAMVASNVATLSSTASGRYTIAIKNINNVYKVYITQDIL